MKAIKNMVSTQMHNIYQYVYPETIPVDTLMASVDIKTKEYATKLFRNKNEITYADLERLLIKIGNNGREGNSSYFDFLEKLMTHHSGIKRKIGHSKLIYQSFLGCQFISLTHGLTYDGIKSAMALKKISAEVILSLGHLEKVLNDLDENQEEACILDAGLLLDGKKNFHAIAAYLKSSNQGIQIVLLDSEGKQREAESFKALLNLNLQGKTLKIYNSCVYRQESAATCYAFAIADCEAYTQGEVSIEEILSLNNLDSRDKVGTIENIEKLPYPLMQISEEDRSIEEAVRLQALLIFHSIHQT